MSIRESIELDLRDLVDNTKFGNEYEEDNAYQFIKQVITDKFTEREKDDYSISLDDIAELLNILNNTDKTLRECFIEMIVYLDGDNVGCNKIRPVATDNDEDDGSFKQMIYTIEYGKIIESQGCYERYCTNEISMIDEAEYKKTLAEILTSSIGNDSQLGYYVECYYDEETINEIDLQMLKDSHCLQDCASKLNLIQQFLIDNTGKCIDYIY